MNHDYELPWRWQDAALGIALLGLAAFVFNGAYYSYLALPWLLLFWSIG